MKRTQKLQCENTSINSNEAIQQYFFLQISNDLFVQNGVYGKTKSTNDFLKEEKQPDILRESLFQRTALITNERLPDTDSLEKIVQIGMTEAGFRWMQECLKTLLNGHNNSSGRR